MNQAREIWKLPDLCKANGPENRGVHFSSREMPFPQQGRKGWPKCFVKKGERDTAIPRASTFTLVLQYQRIPIKLREMTRNWSVTKSGLEACMFGEWGFGNSSKLLTGSVFGLPWLLNRNPGSSGQNWKKYWKRDIYGLLENSSSTLVKD